MLPEKWPQWILIPIGFLLIAAITGAGFGVVTAVQAALPGAEVALRPTSVYEESVQSPGLLAYAHAQEGLECMDCHVWEEPAAIDSVRRLTTKMDFCFDCHLANEHTSYAQVIERTADYIIADQFINPTDTLVEDKNINPHDPHPGLELEELECSRCHLMHGESPLLEGCFTCHHQGHLMSCNSIDCHAE